MKSSSLLVALMFASSLIPVSNLILVSNLTLASIAQGQSPPTGPEGSVSSLRSRAVAALREGDSKAALEAVDRLIELEPIQPASMLLAGDVSLRCNRIDAAVRWFDRFLETTPQALPELWQRGIALYFAGDYKRGAEQFEVHRRVNPNDVENAAWHFLCVSKSDSIETARRLVLPAPNDPRIPMEEVLAMLSNGDMETVRRRMEEVKGEASLRQQADFYGNFYLGLYADAKGDATEALRLLRQSASQAPHHYMGDVARVYVEHLRRQSAEDPPP